MHYLKEKIESLISGKNKIENQWSGVADLPASLGLSMDGIVSDFKEITHKEYPESKNAYLKVVRTALEFSKQIKNMFKDNQEFAKEIASIAKESGHTVEKLGNIGLRVSNSKGPVIDVDYKGNIEFINASFGSPAIEKYVNAVTNKFKDNKAYIVFKGGEKFSDDENRELLTIIAKSMIQNDIDFKRLHLADKKYQSVIDEFTPTPIKVDLINGKFYNSEVDVSKDPKSSEFALALKGMNCIKFAGGNKEQFSKYLRVYENEHDLKISFSEKGEVVHFSSTISESIVSFRTASIKEGGLKIMNVAKSSWPYHEMVDNKKTDKVEVATPKTVEQKNQEILLSFDMKNTVDEKGKKSPINTRSVGFKNA